MHVERSTHNIIQNADENEEPMGVPYHMENGKGAQWEHNLNERKYISVNDVNEGNNIDRIDATTLK